MKKAIVLAEIEELIKEGRLVLDTKYSTDFYTLVKSDINIKWRTKILFFMKKFLDEEDVNIRTIEKMKHNYFTDASSCVGILENIKEYVDKDIICLEEKEEVDVVKILNNVFTRFHRVARQIRSRHASRPTLEIEDEYDVQDLLHSLLHLYFNDIRNEEWTPSYAGSAARVDFLLKEEQVIIEVKKTRQGLADKEVGNQLIEDIERYRVHPDCKMLVCFVYDPEGRIGNPNGVMNDLNTRHNGFVRVFIQPNV